MSINEYTSDHLQETQRYWWSQSSSKISSSNNYQLYHNTHHHVAAAGAMLCGQITSAVSFNLNNNEDEEELIMADDGETNNSTSMEFEHEGQEHEIPKMPLFEKPLTPSDVGKLNRLVIPKQHAEKCFPLNGGGSGDQNGFMLSFEDEVGKIWRFRYSYWNSSKSYVLTKGWSRFVKEKRLGAGDIVVFSRHCEDISIGRLFIGWRRMRISSCVDESGGIAQTPAGDGGGSGGGRSRIVYPGHHPQPSRLKVSSSLSYQPESDFLHAGSVIIQKQTKATSGNIKKLRLFGVNLELQQADESEPLTPEGSPMSSQGQTHQHPYFNIPPTITPTRYAKYLNPF